MDAQYGTYADMIAALNEQLENPACKVVAVTDYDVTAEYQTEGGWGERFSVDWVYYPYSPGNERVRYNFKATVKEIARRFKQITKPTKTLKVPSGRVRLTKRTLAGLDNIVGYLGVVLRSESELTDGISREEQEDLWRAYRWLEQVVNDRAAE